MKRMSKFIPMAVVALGLVGALSSFTTRNDGKETINIQGYIKGNPQGTICTASSLCSDDGVAMCTVGSTQLWGKDSFGNCVVELKRNHQ